MQDLRKKMDLQYLVKGFQKFSFFRRLQQKLTITSTGMWKCGRRANTSTHPTPVKTRFKFDTENHVTRTQIGGEVSWKITGNNVLVVNGTTWCQCWCITSVFSETRKRRANRYQLFYVSNDHVQTRLIDTSPYYLALPRPDFIPVTRIALIMKTPLIDIGAKCIGQISKYLVILVLQISA